MRVCSQCGKEVPDADAQCSECIKKKRRTALRNLLIFLPIFIVLFIGSSYFKSKSGYIGGGSMGLYYFFRYINACINPKVPVIEKPSPEDEPKEPTVYQSDVKDK